MTPKEISNLLNQRALEVAKMLLPAGKPKGKEWVVGDTTGSEGKSTYICVSGDKVGVWTDWATGETGGDLLDLWQVVRSINLKSALEEAKSFLGVSDSSSVFHEIKPKKNYNRPKKQSSWKAVNIIRGYLYKRGFTDETIARFKLAEENDSVIFPYMRNDELIMCKRRSINEKKFMLTESNLEPCLFGWQALDGRTREVAICEGEFDAMALTQMGVPALSVPFGGGKGAKHNWIETEYENLERFDKIFICMDTDEAGQTAARDIIERLGAYRCRLVNLPAKDANDCLMEGVPVEYVKSCFDRAVTLDPQELRSATQFADDVMAEIYPEDYPQAHSFLTPWPKANDKIQFRESELTIINGVNGHGKSQMAGHIIVEAMRQGEKVCIASMEMKPGRLLGRLTKQAAGLRDQRPTRDYINAIIEWYDEKLWLFDLVGTAKQDRLLEVFAYARKRYGISVFVVDSLLKCGIGEDDYNGQKLFIERLCDFKQEHNCHVILITHSKKTESEMKVSGKMDVRGAQAITDLADNLFICHRNKKKEKELESPNEDTDIEALEQTPDALLICEKQRNHPQGWEGKIALWFCRNSNQYLSGPDQKPFQYVNYKKNEVVGFK